jgi:diguanylate cyclase (GGDEF)-like protein
MLIAGFNLALLVDFIFQLKKINARKKNPTVDLELDKKVATSETFIRKMLHEMKENVDVLSKEIINHDNKLEEHKTNINQSSSLSSLSAIQSVLENEISNVLDANSKLNQNLHVAKEQIAEQQEDLNLLRIQVVTDELTGLYNRRGYENLIIREFRRAKRYNRDLSLIIGDIDHFKKINDTHGHFMGDKVLQVFANILKKYLRESDICTRIGGEEFAVIIPEQSEENASSVAEKIRQIILKSTFIFDNVKISFTSSFGVSSTNNAKDFEDLFKNADKALYHAKQTGRNKVCTYTETKKGIIN